MRVMGVFMAANNLKVYNWRDDIVVNLQHEAKIMRTFNSIVIIESDTCFPLVFYLLVVRNDNFNTS